MDKADKKKLVLVFPPYVLATSPPLGVCVLKGYIEKVLPDWSVKVIDLNLLCQDKALKSIAERQFLSEIEFPEGLLGEIALSRAGECFRGWNEQDFFNRPDRYAIYASLLYRLMVSEGSKLNNSGSHDLGDVAYSFMQEAADIVLAEKPDVIGISASYTNQVWPSIHFGKALRQKTAIPIIFGGTFFTKDTASFLRDHSDIANFVVIGEGELALQSLLSDPDHPELAPNVSYLKNGMLHQVDSTCECVLDNFGHPDFSDLDLRMYFSPMPILPIATSRGCYWRRCAFCALHKGLGPKYRRFSIPHVIDELVSHVQHGVKHFYFVDEIISPKVFNELADEIQRSGLDIAYYALAKPTKEFRDEILENIYRSGCKLLIWGVESGTQRILDLMEKGTNLKEISSILHISNKIGIRNHVFMMFGFPTEELADFQQSIRFLETNRKAIYGIHVCQFNLQNDSAIFINPGRFRVTNIESGGDYHSYTGYRFVCEVGLTALEVGRLISQYESFWRAFNPYAPELQVFRDHALLIYEHHGKALDRISRPIELMISARSSSD